MACVSSILHLGEHDLFIQVNLVAGEAAGLANI
jgi:hypothetical protein